MVGKSYTQPVPRLKPHLQRMHGVWYCYMRQAPWWSRAIGRAATPQAAFDDYWRDWEKQQRAPWAWRSPAGVAPWARREQVFASAKQEH